MAREINIELTIGVVGSGRVWDIEQLHDDDDVMTRAPSIYITIESKPPNSQTPWLLRPPTSARFFSFFFSLFFSQVPTTFVPRSLSPFSFLPWEYSLREAAEPIWLVLFSGFTNPSPHPSSS